MMVVARGRGGSADSDTARRLQVALDRLMDEYSDRLAPGAVVRCVARSTRAATGLGLESGDELAWVVENLARAMLDARLGVIDLDAEVLLPRQAERVSARTLHGG